MPMPENPHTYDVSFYVNSRPFLRKLDRGVTVSAAGLSWTKDDARTDMQFGNMVAIHLKSSGQKVKVDQCAITFADDTVLTVVDSTPGGYADRTLTATYRDFVRDLHARLAAGSYGGNIQFIAGWPAWRYYATLALTAATALLFFGGGLAYWRMYGDPQGLVFVLLGGYFCWTLGRRTLANAPRDYTPDRLPEALLS